MAYQPKCPICMKEVPFTIKDEEFLISVKNEEFLITGKRAFCTIDGEELYYPEFDIENQEQAFQLYRHKYGIVHPSEIKEAREKYTLTQREYSYLLGFGEITISRYERGSVPTIAQSNVIRDSFNPLNFIKMIPDKHEKFTEDRLKEIKELIRSKQPTGQILIEKVTKELQQNIIDNKSFNYDKFSNMVQVFAQECSPYITKLNKLMFYADFYHFKKYNVSISGVDYVRLQYGPVPKRYSILYEFIPNIQREEMEYGERIVSETNELVPIYLSSIERESLQVILHIFREYTSNEISDFSHEEKAWKEIKNNFTIPYAYAEFLRIP